MTLVHKTRIASVVLGSIAAVLTAATLALAALHGCTPAQQQLGARLGLAGGEIACVIAAQCSGIVVADELADFCRLSADEVRRYLDAEADAGEGPNCPLEDGGGQ
ncbi:MAG: hypothetical protein WC683_09525 [bacterium]|jgi:hypothetical protein